MHDVQVGDMLAQVLESETSRLESMQLQNNKLGEAGCLALVNAALAQAKPCSLNLTNNGLAFSGTRRLRAMLRKTSPPAAIHL